MACDTTGQGTDVLLVSGGINASNDLTVAALAGLRRCVKIFTVLPLHAFEGLPRDIVAKLISHWDQYTVGGLRQHCYEEQVEAVLCAVSASRPVGVLAQGHPLIFDSVCAQLLERGLEQGLDMSIIPGVSAIDAVLATLRYHIAPGLQIYDASALLLHRIEPRTDVPCLLLQPHVFGTSFVAVHRRPSGRALEPLRDHLLKCYPPHHRVLYVTAGAWKSVPTTVHKVPLHRLAGSALDRTAPMGASLFIPPSEELTTDPLFAARMADRAEFESCYPPVTE